MQHTQRILAFATGALFFLTYCSEAADPDRILTPQNGFMSAAGKGVADAGTAVAWNAASVFVNPALLYSCRTSGARVSRSLYAGYGRDSLFDRFIVPVGYAYSEKRNAIAGFFRAMSSGFGLEEYDAGAAFCRRVWTTGHPRGPFDMGMHVRYEYGRWSFCDLDTLYTVRSHVAPSGTRVRLDSIAGGNQPPENGRFRESRIFLDIGLFKPEIASHLDCGIAFKNLIAFRFGRQRPHVREHVDTVGTVDDTVTVIEYSGTYDSSYTSYRDWIAAKYAAVSIGWNLKIGNPAGNLSLAIPLDVRVYGLFNRSMKETFAIHCGVQAHLVRDFFVRVGYEHAPAMVYDGFRDLALANNVSLGAAMLLPGLPAVVDCYIRNFDWGMSLAFDY
ncbi:MAG: hypothetical protein JW768_15090 [Chitinispirillaceae bacterium]|nr:hypothetical protein [Chitinispirillaceae bacterium]